MSDYLWDKTGEPDAEVERLENLLGQLRFQQTPFDLPAELPAKDFRAARSRASVLAWPRLALAASLTLAVLAGAWVMLRQQTKTANDAPQLAKQDDEPGANDKQFTSARSQPAEVAPTAETTKTEDGAVKNGVENPAVGPSPVESPLPRESRGGGTFKPRRPDLANNSKKGAPRFARAEVAGRAKRRDKFITPPREETARLTPEEREAAEKVLYALRVTSEKLNYAREQVRQVGRSEANR